MRKEGRKEGVAFVEKGVILFWCVSERGSKERRECPSGGLSILGSRCKGMCFFFSLSPRSELVRRTCACRRLSRRRPALGLCSAQLHASPLVCCRKNSNFWSPTYASLISRAAGSYVAAAADGRRSLKVQSAAENAQRYETWHAQPHHQVGLEKKRAPLNLLKWLLLNQWLFA